jgi:hypothetical protein
MFKSTLLTIVSAATLLVPAFAADGTTLINQSTVMAGGGFPYHITQSGSYRLSGNLVATGGAMIISAANVTVDMNGFTISCASNCANLGVSSTATGTTLMNGSVTGFAGGTAINFTTSASKVDHVNASGSGTGIQSGGDLIVTYCNVSNNTYGVVVQASNLTLLSSAVSANAQDGVDVFSGLINGNTISGNGSGGTNIRGGILLWGGAVNIINNSITGNAVFGIAKESPGSSATAGYGLNTFGGNAADVGSGAATSMNNNVCGGGNGC